MIAENKMMCSSQVDLNESKNENRQSRYICTKINHPLLSQYHFTLVYFDNITLEEIVAIRNKLNILSIGAPCALGAPTKAMTTVFYNQSLLNNIKEKMYEEVEKMKTGTEKWTLNKRLDKFNRLVRVHISVKGNESTYNILFKEASKLTTDGNFYTACGNKIDE